MSTFTKKLAALAEGQYNQFHWYHEGDQPLKGQIGKYWSENNWQVQPVSTAWSAAFVSWCVRKAGALPTEFRFDPMHSTFVYDAIKTPRAYRGVDFNALPIEVGDILQNNRSGQAFDFAYAQAHASYTSHSAIVIEVGADSGGPYALTVGGNEADSVGRKRVSLTSAGKVKVRVDSPYIALLKCLK
jgi:hypothetical protein